MVTVKSQSSVQGVRLSHPQGLHGEQRVWEGRKRQGESSFRASHLQGLSLGEGRGMGRGVSLAEPQGLPSDFGQEGVKVKLNPGQTSVAQGLVQGLPVWGLFTSCACHHWLQLAMQTFTLLGHEKHRTVMTSCLARRLLASSLRLKLKLFD